MVTPGGALREYGLGEPLVCLPAGDEFAPLNLVFQVGVEGSKETEGRPEGVADEVHVRLLGSAARLAMVAGLAGGYNVLPVMAAAPVSG